MYKACLLQINLGESGTQFYSARHTVRCYNAEIVHYH